MFYFSPPQYLLLSVFFSGYITGNFRVSWIAWEKFRLYPEILKLDAYFLEFLRKISEKTLQFCNQRQNKPKIFACGALNRRKVSIIDFDQKRSGYMKIPKNTGNHAQLDPFLNKVHKQLSCATLVPVGTYHLPVLAALVVPGTAVARRLQNLSFGKDVGGFWV